MIDTSIRPSTYVRLAATGGRSDLLRVVLTAAGSILATFALMWGLAVLLISEENGPYRLTILEERGLHQGIVVGILLLTIPLLIFVGQSSRVGAPARDRRLAMMRMAGATPSEVRTITALETGFAATVGAILGVAAFYVIQPLLSFRGAGTLEVESFTNDGFLTIERVDFDNLLLLPTDVNVSVLYGAGLVALIGLGATLASVVALRKVAISPFGVTRSVNQRPSRTLPPLLYIVSFVGLLLVGGAYRALEASSEPPILLLAISFLLVLIGAGSLIVGAASTASMVGNFLAPKTRNPALLIASRRMVAAPYTSSRATTSVVLAVFIGAALQVTRVTFLAAAEENSASFAQTFSIINLVLVAAVVISAASLLVVAAEAIVERRRTLATLAATGVPRSTLAQAVLAETLVPLIPAVVLAAGLGTFGARGIWGTSVSVWNIDTESDEFVNVPFPLESLSLLTGGALAASMGITALSLVLLRRSTSAGELRAAA